MKQSEYLMQLLKKDNITLTELSRRIGCSYDIVQRNIKGDSVLSLNAVFIMRICYAFNMTLEDFYTASQLHAQLGPLAPKELLLVEEIRRHFPLDASNNVLDGLGCEEIFLVMQYRASPQFSEAIKKLLDMPL